MQPRRLVMLSCWILAWRGHSGVIGAWIPLASTQQHPVTQGYIPSSECCNSNRRGRRQQKESTTLLKSSGNPEGSLQSFLKNINVFRSEETPPEPEEEESTGWFRGWFRRKKDNEEPEDQDTNKRAKSLVKNKNKKTESKPSKASPPKKDPKTKPKPKKDEQIKEEEGPSLGSRIRSFFNTTKDEKEVKDTKEPSSNPISVVQTFFQNNDEEWVDVFPKTRIMPGEAVPVTVGGIDLLVIASNDGRNKLYCIANSCPHLGTPLETGRLVRLPIENKKGGTSSSAAAAAAAAAASSTGSKDWTERDIASLLQQDGCETCIVCPLHRTAFALESGEVRGEWCPYPPVLGKVVGVVKEPTPVATFDVRARGRNVQVRINSPLMLKLKQEGK